MEVSYIKLYSVFALLLRISVHGQVSDRDRCPPRLAYAYYTFQDKCYEFINHEEYWAEGQSYCEGNGGKMLEIYDQATMDFIRYNLDNVTGWTEAGVWIGATDSAVEGTWEWHSGSVFHYSYWGEGEPVDYWPLYHRDCGLLRREYNWRWAAYPCYSLGYYYKFICMYGAHDSTTKHDYCCHQPDVIETNDRIQYTHSSLYCSHPHDNYHTYSSN
ncbi:lithostathine-1-alpha-like [Lingula anatina]|uniref:Lithostathine-1-alpha-like n=1 Tax=Lingula anatina TaxID=7574 RepID=A0A1S3HWY6_LINAN|nr:lithostathine-1-alpha-like [Lingula anatina]|eukprot:XP_013390557.1 lithostathine-1-alpha-like [Lingula anatina]